MNIQIENLFRSGATEESVEESTNSKEPNVEENDEVRKRTYHESGFRDGSRNIGSPRTLSICLNAIYAKFQNEEKEMVEKQRLSKEPYINEQRNKQTEVKTLALTKDRKTENIAKLDTDIRAVNDNIEALKFEINDLARNPEKYHLNAQKGASAKFWIGLIILLPISLYLFTFYISTSYSAFFKTFDGNADNIFLSVLDPKALDKAWKDGLLEGAFVTLIPFVFLGLGYLIHMFGEAKSKKNYLKIGLLFATTLIFDAILAYQIEDKIYDLTKTYDSPAFDLSVALHRIQFWGIIFAGFVVYIIWGVVFDFIMKEHREKDVIQHEQQKRKKDIQIHQERITDIEKKKEVFSDELKNTKEMIVKAEGRIVELQHIIDAIIIPTKEYVLYASEYMQGWITFINQKIHISKYEKDILLNECIMAYDENLKAVGASEDAQNSVYATTL